MITFIIIIIIALIVFLFCYFYQLYQHEYDKFILQNSLCLKQLKEINNRYKFHPDIRFDQCHTYDNDKIYSTISSRLFNLSITIHQ